MCDFKPGQIVKSNFQLMMILSSINNIYYNIFSLIDLRIYEFNLIPNYDKIIV